MRLPTDVSTEGWRIDRLLGITNWMVAVIGVIFVVWLAVSLWRGVRRRHADGVGSKRSEAFWPLIFAALILVVVDGTLFVTSTRDLHGAINDIDGALAADDTVRIEVSAQQWAWNVRYPGPDGLFATADDPVVVGEIVVPIGRPVVIELAAVDVVHSLHLPQLRIKRDAIPGRLSRVWFEATSLGTFDILCAQFCGTNHYRMQGILRVVTDEGFNAWRASASVDSLSIRKEDQRSRLDEPGRQKPRGMWPTFERPPFGRDWGWPWGSERGRTP